MVNVYFNLKKLRKKCKKTQKQVSEELFISVYKVQKAENDPGTLTLLELWTFCNLYKIKDLCIKMDVEDALKNLLDDDSVTIC